MHKNNTSDIFFHEVMCVKKYKFLYLVGLLWTAALGTLLHFTYEWSDENTFVGLFSAVNESIWEHTKLLFFPAAVFAPAVYPFVKKDIPRFLNIFAVSILLGIAFQTIAYYAYSGIIGMDIPWVNILLFFVSTALIFYSAYKAANKNSQGSSLPGLTIITILAIIYFYFTANPPSIGIFQSPEASSITQFSYGVI